MRISSRTQNIRRLLGFTGKLEHGNVVGLRRGDLVRVDERPRRLHHFRGPPGKGPGGLKIFRPPAHFFFLSPSLLSNGGFSPAGLIGFALFLSGVDPEARVVLCVCVEGIFDAIHHSREQRGGGVSGAKHVPTQSYHTVLS